MIKKLRKEAFLEILKNAGILSDLVDRAISKKTGTKPYQMLGLSLGSGTSVLFPAEPVKPDGTVDILISLKAVGLGDTKTAARTGTKAVIVSAYLDLQGGSTQYKEQFGSANFVNKAVGTIISYLKKMYPDKNVRRGKLGVVWWSGGYDAGRSIIDQRTAIPGGINAVVALDGGHGKSDRYMQPFWDYAREAQQGKGKFVFVSTGVEPGKYPSTSAVSQRIADHLNLSYQNVDPQSWTGRQVAPAAIAKSKNVSLVQLYKPYDKANPYKLKEMMSQHGEALRWGLYNLNGILGW